MKTRALLSCLILPALAMPLVAGDLATVHVASGRTFRGQVDPQTGDTTLVLRIGTPSLFVCRPIAWERITVVVAKGKEYSPAEFQRQIASSEWQWAGETTGDSDRLRLREPASPPNVTALERAALPEFDVPFVAGLHIEAYVANWDSDVEPDGLVVHVYPLDATGCTVPALGTLQVELIGDGPTNRVSGNPNPLLGQWSEVVQPFDVGTNGAVFQFPFTWVHPDFASKWSVGSFGMVHARLAVGGQGVFEDTAAFTRIRPYSPVRDRMQQQQLHRRFVPSELTSYPYR